MAEMVYTIYEQPVLENPTSGEPVLENPTSDNPVSENPTQLNKDIQTKDQKNTDGSITDSIPILSPPSTLKEAAAPPERKRTERNDAYKVYEEIIKENIEYDYLLQDFRFEKDQVDEIVDLILETVCSAKKTIRIAGDDYPAELFNAPSTIGSYYTSLVSHDMASGKLTPPKSEKWGHAHLSVFEGLGHIPTNPFAGAKGGSGYPLPMLAM
jgi:hypothetical protein